MIPGHVRVLLADTTRLLEQEAMASLPRPTNAGPPLTDDQWERLKGLPSLRTLARTQVQQHDLAGATATVEKILANERETLGEFHEDVHRTLVFRASLCEATGDVVAANRARGGLLDFMKALYGPNDFRVKWTEQDFGKRGQSARIATGPDQKSGEPKASEPDFSRFYRRDTSEELAVILLVAPSAMGRCRARSRSTAPGSSANWPSCC